MMILPILLVTFCSCAYGERNYSHTAHEFVRKSQQLATFGSNSLERLENFVDNFEEYLTLGSRLGDVLTAIVAGSKFERGSDQYDALVTLNVEWIDFLGWSSPTVHNVAPTNAVQPFWDEYYDKITVPHVEWQSLFKDVTNPKFMSNGDNFKKMCRSQAVNEEIFDEIELLFKFFNPLPRDEYFASVIMVQQAFHNFESQGEFSKSLPEEYITLKHDVLALSFFDRNSFEDVTRELENREATVDNITSSATLRSLVAIGRLYRLPFLKYYHGNYQRMGPLMMLIERLTLEIIQVESMTALCMNITFNERSDPNRSISSFIGVHLDSVKRITNRARMWVEQAQRLSWPRIGVGAAKMQLGKQEIPVSEYYSTAATVQKIFKERSTDSVTYQVLVVPSSEIGDWWSVRNQNQEHYANFTTVTSLDVHVFRFINSELNRTNESFKWINANRDAIHDVLRRGVSDSADELMNSLSANPATKPIFEYYRSVILFHGRSLLKSRAKINYGLAPSQNGFELVEYSENGFFAHNWKLFMFL